ncbi:MAG: radical SAM protein [Solirubrobacteraceae bacterium]
MRPLELLKLRLLADGTRVAPEAATAWRECYDGPLTLAEYATTSGVALVLPGNLYVNAPLAGPEEDTPVLRHDGDRFLVEDRGQIVGIDVIPVPAFHDRTYERPGGGLVALTRLGVTHTDRCRVSPVEGCAWNCAFCDLPFEFPKYVRKEREQLLELIEIAVRDPQAPARHVLVSGGTPGPVHESWIDDVYAFLARESPVPVDVMMPPRDDPQYPVKLAAMGVNAASINMEVSDPDRAFAVIPRKSRRYGREYVLDYIATAVEAFGVGQVQSLMVFGSAIESSEATLRGVRDLVDRGCIPVLSAFRPHHLTPLRDAPPASFEEMVRVYEGTLEICAAAGNGILPGPRCVPCQHNTVTVPIDGDFYIGPNDDPAARCATS